MMKTYKILTLISLTAVSCTGLRHAAKVSEPVAVDCTVDYECTSPDTFCVGVTADVPQEFRNPNTGILVVPVLRGDDSTETMRLNAFVAEGLLHSTFNARKQTYEPELSDSALFRTRYSKDGRTAAASTTEISVEDWMKDCSLNVDVYADSYTRRILLGSYSFPIVLKDLNSYADLAFVEKWYYTFPAPAPTKADTSDLSDGFRFSLDSFSIEDKEIAGALGAYVRDVLSSIRTEDYTVAVTVSNSPEGSIGHNRELGQNRLNAAKQLLSEAGIDLGKCTFAVIDENWDALRAAVAAGTLQSREEILTVIDTEEDPDIREHRIRDEYYREWKQLRKEIYPSLRYCDIAIAGTFRPDSFTTSAQAPAADADALNDEMLGKIRRGDNDGALDAAVRIPNGTGDARILSNKANVLLRHGRFDEARALLKRCQDVDEARYNLAVLYIMDRNYSAAEPLLEDNDCINKAVVKTALGKKDEAREVLVLLEDSPAKAGLLEMLEDK